DLRVLGRRRRKHPDFAAVKRHRHAAIAHAAQRGDRAIETPDLRRARRIEPPDRHAVGDVDRLAVGRDILGRIELPGGLGLLQDLVRLQRTVERRHGDGGVAPPEQAVGEFLQRPDLWPFPQRRSYWTKFGSALPSLYLPIRLFMMPPR